MTWIEKDKALHREIKTPDYVTAFSLVAALTPLAEKAGHHPDLELGWGYVRIKLTTHDAGGVTDKDHALAKAIDQLAVKFGLQ
ncbi:MAG: 4a-hydroxytetrahydrobiopterin dehydratase [Acidobacteria bacterium]|nr:4a-hydroxytetrahydrobiopterin dehydratase [Acidobacteriota bacterium]